jgi:hypothetical protein
MDGIHAAFFLAGMAFVLVGFIIAGALPSPVWTWGHHYRDLERRCERLRRLADTSIVAAEVAAETLERRTPTPLSLDDRRYLASLRRKLVLHLDDSELQTAAFDTNVDYDSLDGGNKQDKARELVLCLARQKRVGDLVEALQSMRPDVEWGAV